MAKYAVSPEGVAALRSSATKVSEGIEKIDTLAKQMGTVADGYSTTLGPHRDELIEILDEIGDAIGEAADPAESVAEKLEDIADGYEDVIESKRFKQEGGENSASGAGASNGSSGNEERGLSWTGDKKNSKCVPTDPNSKIAKELAEFGVDGIEYKNGNVDFSPVSKFSIPFEDQEGLYQSIGSFPIGKLMTEDGFKERDAFNNTVRTEWQKIAKQELVDKIKNDTGFASDFASKTGINTGSIKSVAGLDDELKRVGLTLHETPDCSQIQLVPTSIHSYFKHDGGTSAMLERLLSGDLH